MAILIDARVKSAIHNWAPRFIANGVDYNDFVDATTRIKEWREWCSVWSSIGAVHRRLADASLAEGFTLSASRHFFQAAMAYHFGKFLFVDWPAERRRASQLTVEYYARAVELSPTPGQRVEIPGLDSNPIPGVLRRPAQEPCPPVVILIPGLDSVKEEMHCYGDDFLARGMAVLAIDGPGQGELEDAGIMMRPDYETVVSAVVDYVQGRPDLNGRVVGLMGVSVGGYYAVRAAAHDSRIVAAIESGGPYSLAEDFDAVPELTRRAFVVRTGSADEETARQYLLQFTLHGVLDKVSRPLLIIHGGRDRLFPVEVAQRIAKEVGEHAELWVVEEGNHLCNNMPYAVRPRQADWMKSVLTTGRSR